MTTRPIAHDLRVEQRLDPIGLDELLPQLTWRMALAHPAIEQSAFAIQVATDPAFAPATLVWTREESAATETAIVYGGPPPGSRERLFWRVRVIDDRGRSGPWSAPGSWEMGLLVPDDWVAQWIGWIDPDRPSWSSRSPILRRAFRLRGRVVRGRAYMTASGLVELSINGGRVGTDLLMPGWSDYRQRVPYGTADVAHLLRSGENVVAARLGRGWFAGEVGQFGAEHYGDFPALLAQLEIDFADGRRQTVATGGSWRADPGPLVEDDLLNGEWTDARCEPDGWDRPGFSDDTWRDVTIAAAPGGRLVARREPGVNVIAELKPRTIRSPEGGRQIVDFGQNIAGNVTIRATAPAGTTVTIRHAEVLDAEGELYTASLRTARQTDRYTFHGRGEETVEPRFTTHGFRYAEVSGLSTGLDRRRIKARALSSMVRTAGSFACSDELVEAIHRNVVWGLRGGLVGIPTDCPQRDERLGWTGDAAAMAPSALFLGDTAPLFEKWLVDLADAQLPSGAYPDVAPRIGVTGAGNAGWADAGILVPWALYRSTGALRVLERQYDSMRRYLDYLRVAHVGGVRHGGRYGDWLALETPTSLELIGTSYLAYSAQLFARMARLLGRDDDARIAGRLAASARAAFRRRFTTEAGLLERETQTGYALALGFDLLPRGARRRAGDRLVRLITDANGHLLTGFIGTSLVLHALSELGHHELAAQIVRQDTYPGWGFEVRQGATTIWERWDAWTPEGGFADPSMNSFNHAALASVASWLHEHLAGLAPGTPGYRTMLVRPRPVVGIERASASHDSVHGRHAATWQGMHRRFQVRLDVPPNTFADIVIPAPVRSLWVGGAPARAGVGGVVRVASTRQARRVVLSWGHHVVDVER